ncbi:MAG: hypothetical protein JNJ54_20975 [Myxococcaceae bacterium]|nr:hypothetical protein [Myxococcaceae bacterium]
MRTLMLFACLVAPISSAAEPPRDFCEYTVEGEATNRGSGGPSNVMSLHWMGPTQVGRSIATPLLINCGAGAQLNIDTVGRSSVDDVKMAPGRYAIDTKKPKKGAFGVRGSGFFSAEGELVISAWDTAHVAGTFSFKTNTGKRYTGAFDLRCPYAGNGVCR